MIEPTVFLQFDQALDGQPVPDLDGAQSLIATAHTVQTLFDHQRNIPSEEFIMHLEATLFPNLVIPSKAEESPVFSVIPSGVEGPPAAAVSRPRSAPRPARIQPERTRVFHRWIAVAAVLLLLVGGAGAIIYGPFQSRPTPEPSAIPAASFGTPVTSPKTVQQSWVVVPPPGLSGSDRPAPIANGRIYRTFSNTNQSPIQAVDLQTGAALWVVLPRVSTDLLAATDDLLLIAGSDGNDHQLVALDGQTGAERWSETLAQAPKGLLVGGAHVFVLGEDDLLEAFDLSTQERFWQSDLGQFGDTNTGVYEGVNNFGDLAGDRMVAADGTIGTIVSSGRLIAVDAVDGAVQWADKRSTNGWTRVKIVDGRFVVIAWGNETLMYDPAATPIPMTPTDPASDPCTLTIETRTGPIPSGVPGIGATVDAFDPKTGASPWGLVLPEQYLAWPLDENRLVTQVEQIQSAGVADSSDLNTCLIDGATGTVSQTTGAQLADLVIPDGGTGEYWGVSGLPDGIPLWIIPMDRGIASSLPPFDPGTDFSGIRWVQRTSDLILITARDGALIGLPDRPTSTSSTQVSASAGWTVPAPAGTHAESQDTSPVVANGRIFRSFYTATADYRTQAVDMMTGAVLWDRPLDVRGEVMASSGDRLLVGGQVGALLKDFALVALDQTSGDEVRRIELSGLPKAIITDGDRAFVLSADNQLDAVDLQTGTSIYATDIGGKSKPVDPAMATGSQYGMVIDGNTLIAVLADGSVTGVDPESGEGRWWNLRKWTGGVRVDSIAGALIVTDSGDTSFYLPEGNRNTDGLATLVAVATPTVATCLDNLSAASPVATPEPQTVPNFITTITRIDPETGAVRWSVRDPGTFMSLLTSDTDMTYLVSTAAEWPGNRSQIAICVIDLRTGRSSEVKSLSGVIDSTFLLTMTDRPEWILVAGRLDNGELGAFPAIFDPTVSGPEITIDLSAHGGTSWMGIYDNAIYLSRMDGQLEKIPIPAY